MPSKDVHIWIAILTAIVLGLVFLPAGLMFDLDFYDYVIYAWVIILGAMIPDTLDPWSKENRYNHRKFWHSKRMLNFLYIVLPISFVWALFQSWMFYTFFIIVGYITHLWADAYKPKSWSKGLPN